jgi:hypothetical protein
MSRMMPRVLMPAVLVRCTRRIRVAQHESQSPIDRGEHEAGGDKCAKTQHREHERRSPLSCASEAQPAFSLPRHRTKMPHRM